MAEPQYFTISKGILFLLFFAFTLFFDCRKRRIPSMIFLLFGGILLIHSIFFRKIYYAFFSSLSMEEFPLLLLPTLFAFFLLLLSKWSREAIGYGDSLFILLSSFYCNAYHFFFLIITAFFFSTLVSMFLFCSCKLKKKNPKNFRFPFLPCFLPGVLYLLGISFF